GAKLSLDATPNLQVLLFHLGTAVLLSFLFGLAPVWKGRRGGADRLMLSMQVALSVVVLVGAGMFLRTVQSLRSTELGFRPDHLLLVALDPKNAGRSD